MRIKHLFLMLPLAAVLTGCPTEEVNPVGACDPACNADQCMICDDSGETGVCRTACGDGLTCESGQCLAPEVSTCEPACGACQACDTTGASATCVDLCGDGTTCQEGACISDGVDACGGCAACQACDTSGAAPACVDLCADGTVCDAGACVVAAPTCDPACGPCQQCDESGAAPVCVDQCGDGTTCQNTVCVPAAGVRVTKHANFEALQGPFANGPAVTAACLGCHQKQADDFMMTQHWTWTGPTPNLVGHEADTSIGKKNLINNFCVSIDENEARCAQCHAGYGYNSKNFLDTATASKIDCLVCHADPKSGYKKDPKTAGNVPVNDQGQPTVDLVAAAQSVGEPLTKNCGACHFSAGGGDNVKKGDLGSALGSATIDIDVHLGIGITCADCHAGQDHLMLGQGVHAPVAEGRVGCTDCHSEQPHGDLAAIKMPATLDNHTADIACQTCHVPAFSRTQPTKMAWDWSTAGDKTHAVTSISLPGGTRAIYDWMKGDFVWEQNVRPTYAWFDGRASHLTLTDSFPAGQDPVVIAAPVADKSNATAKIFPFKVMVGKQAADATDHFLVAPDLFGPGSFWGAITPCDPASADCNYSPDTAQGLALWNTILTKGARAAGQILSTEAYGAERTFEFVNTEMWLSVNHETAPAAQALGCTDCHGSAGFDFAKLGYTKADGTACDPMVTPSCSRN